MLFQSGCRLFACEARHIRQVVQVVLEFRDVSLNKIIFQIQRDHHLPRCTKSGWYVKLISVQVL